MAATEPGTLEAIHLADREGGTDARGRDAWQAIAGVGLAGDRYAIPIAERDPTDGEVREVTLVEAEQIEWLADETGIALEPGATRRNLTTRGVRLNELVGRTFRVGAVRIQGVELCEPCAHMQELVGRPVLRPLIHRAGLRARLLDDGELRVGDPIVDGLIRSDPARRSGEAGDQAPVDRGERPGLVARGLGAQVGDAGGELLRPTVATGRDRRQVGGPDRLHRLARLLGASAVQAVDPRASGAGRAGPR